MKKILLILFFFLLFIFSHSKLNGLVDENEWSDFSESSFQVFTLENNEKISIQLNNKKEKFNIAVKYPKNIENDIQLNILFNSKKEGISKDPVENKIHFKNKNTGSLLKILLRNNLNSHNFYFQHKNELKDFSDKIKYKKDNIIEIEIPFFKQVSKLGNVELLHGKPGDKLEIFTYIVEKDLNFNKIKYFNNSKIMSIDYKDEIIIENNYIVFETIRNAGIITQLIERLLTQIYKYIKNYGLSIIFLTLIIKLSLLPLTLKQDKSMRDMKKLSPEIEKLKEKHKDPQELNKATMELYQKHGINPLGGCLPSLLQLPILFTLFRVLRNNYIIPEGTKFLFWNLTQKDEFPLALVLPILNAGITYFQQKLMSKNSVKNTQTEMMGTMLPGFILVISLQMPAGLQIYWLTSSLFGLIQHYITSREKK